MRFTTLFFRFIQHLHFICNIFISNQPDIFLKLYLKQIVQINITCNFFIFYFFYKYIILLYKKLLPDIAKEIKQSEIFINFIQLIQILDYFLYHVLLLTIFGKSFNGISNIIYQKLTDNHHVYYKKLYIIINIYIFIIIKIPWQCSTYLLYLYGTIIISFFSFRSIYPQKIAFRTRILSIVGYNKYNIYNNSFIQKKKRIILLTLGNLIFEIDKNVLTFQLD